MLVKHLHPLRSSLAGKILLLFLGFWTTGSVGFGYFFSRHLEGNLVRGTDDVAALTLKNLEQRQKSLESLARWVADKPELAQTIESGDRTKLVRLLLPLQASLHLSGIQIITPKQEILAQVQSEGSIDEQDAGNRSFYKAASMGLEATATLAYRDQPMRSAASVSIKSRQKMLGGIVVLESLDQQWLQLSRTNDSQHLIIMQGDRITASTLPASVNPSIGQLPPLMGAPRWLRVDQLPYIAKSITIPASMGANAQLVILTPASSIQQAQQQIWLFTGLFCLVGVGVAGLMGHLLTGILTRRIKQLTTATQSLATGNLEMRLPVNGHDEVSQLAQSFNLMANQLVIRDRTIQSQMEQLQSTLQTLQQTQTQLVHSEKMSSLGQMVAGVAHEINNPVGFIYSNLNHASQYVEDLLQLIETYQQNYPMPLPAVQARIDEIDLPFVQRDVVNLFASMQTGTSRIKDIVVSLRNFSRLDESEFKFADLQEGLESTLLLLQYRMYAQAERPAIKVVQEYEPLPQIECYPGALNQVFMNLLSNAIDALEKTSNPEIRIQTQMRDRSTIAITIADNGCGIDESFMTKIFDPFFTTKAIGQGTGMGLAISYQIITVQHQGQIFCESSESVGSKFTILMAAPTSKIP